MSETYAVPTPHDKLFMGVPHSSPSFESYPMMSARLWPFTELLRSGISPDGGGCSSAKRRSRTVRNVAGPWS